MSAKSLQLELNQLIQENVPVNFNEFIFNVIYPEFGWTVSDLARLDEADWTMLKSKAVRINIPRGFIARLQQTILANEVQNMIQVSDESYVREDYSARIAATTSLLNAEFGTSEVTPL